jgi:hypothetical protein
VADLLYCGTGPVGPEETRRLLEGEFRAIWFPPSARKSACAAGDRLWLLWHGATGRGPRLLGGGRVEFTPEGQPTWTNRTAPGVRDAARAEGYGGPTNTAFLRLTDVRIDAGMPEIVGLGDVAVGLSEASADQARTLAAILPA